MVAMSEAAAKFRGQLKGAGPHLHTATSSPRRVINIMVLRFTQDWNVRPVVCVTTLCGDRFTPHGHNK